MQQSKVEHDVELRNQHDDEIQAIAQIPEMRQQMIEEVLNKSPTKFNKPAGL